MATSHFEALLNKEMVLVKDSLLRVDATNLSRLQGKYEGLFRAAELHRELMRADVDEDDL